MDLIKTIEERPGIVWVPALILNFFLLYLSIVFTANIIKPIVSDCDMTWNIDKYMTTNYFCPTEDSKIDMMLKKSEEARANRRR